MQPLVPLVFHNLPSLYPPSFRRNDFYSCIHWLWSVSIAYLFGVAKPVYIYIVMCVGMVNVLKMQWSLCIVTKSHTVWWAGL